MPDTRSVDTVKTSPAANPSVTLRFDFGPSQEIAPLHAIHLATCDLAEHALNGSFTIGLSAKHVTPLVFGEQILLPEVQTHETLQSNAKRSGLTVQFT